MEKQEKKNVDNNVNKSTSYSYSYVSNNDLDKKNKIAEFAENLILTKMESTQSLSEEDVVIAYKYAKLLYDLIDGKTTTKCDCKPKQGSDYDLDKYILDFEKMKKIFKEVFDS